MPTNKNALTRIVLLDKLLSDRYHSYSIQDMTDYLNKEIPQFGQSEGVSKRCIEKDIEYLEYQSPFDIEFERYSIDAYSSEKDKPYKKRCIRYADPTFSIFKGKLTAEEKEVLSSALSIIGSFEGLENFEWLDDLTKRLGLIEETPVIQLSQNLLNSSTIMAELFSAIKAKSVINLKYHKFGNKEIKAVILSPYLLKEYNRRWYLIAGAYDTGHILNFALDRIDGIEILTGYVYKEPNEDLSEKYEDIIGITYIETNPLEKILFWVNDKTSDYIKTKPIHGSQIFFKGTKEEDFRNNYPELKGGSFFQIECRKNYELIRELMSFMENLKVLSPKSLTDEIKEHINRMQSLYS